MRAAATLSCSCRHHERWRRSLRRRALDVPRPPAWVRASGHHPAVSNQLGQKYLGGGGGGWMGGWVGRWWWWCRRCVDGRSLSINHHARASNTGGRTPGSQTPVSPTPEPSTIHSCESSRAPPGRLRTAGDVTKKSAITCPRPWACRQSK